MPPRGPPNTSGWTASPPLRGAAQYPGRSTLDFSFVFGSHSSTLKVSFYLGRPWECPESERPRPRTSHSSLFPERSHHFAAISPLWFSFFPHVVPLGRTASSTDQPLPLFVPERSLTSQRSHHSGVQFELLSNHLDFWQILCFIFLLDGATPRTANHSCSFRPGRHFEYG